MPSRRQRIHDFYATPQRLRGIYEYADAVKLSGVPDATGRYLYRGPAVAEAAVVRLDLNGYSTWARDVELRDRVAVLDLFFSAVVPVLDQHGGVYFRDEGDCLVCLFSDYFQPAIAWQQVAYFCRNVVRQEFGPLTAKACVSIGSIAVFQKAHEQGTEDWSAEGQPFVRAARMEAAVTSGQRIHYFAEEYPRFETQSAARGSTYNWTVARDSVQVAGLGLPGGWTDLMVERYLPQGRIA